jgi:hypothetical protein
MEVLMARFDLTDAEWSIIVPLFGLHPVPKTPRLV